MSVVITNKGTHPKFSNKGIIEAICVKTGISKAEVRDTLVLLITGTFRTGNRSTICRMNIKPNP